MDLSTLRKSRSLIKYSIIFLAAAGTLLIGTIAAAQSSLSIEENTAVQDFPESITFQLTASSSAEITSAVLEFGTDSLSCGEGTSRAIPEDYEPGTEIDVEWEWNLRSSGSLPPGTEVWWRWVLEDADGLEIMTDVQTLVFIDKTFAWKTAQSDHISLNWYHGTDQFSTALLQAGENGLQRLEGFTGITTQEKVDIYIYSSSEEMQTATLFAPTWSGGLAFPWDNAIIAGISPSNLGWGMETMAHELAHVVIGQYTFSCVDSTPRWIDEGLAMVTEGGPDPYYEDILERAVDENTLLSVKEVGQIFSADPELALLSYAESYSLVVFLLEEYDAQMMVQLLDRFKEGESEDRALEAVYGFDRDGLEVLWREWLGAEPMAEESEAGDEPTATLPPTFAPITGPSVQATQTPTEPAPDPTGETEVFDNPTEQEQLPEEESQPNQILIFSIIGIVILAAIIVVLLKRKKPTPE